jgi:DNA-directed RNA polymerase specialized sigma24 family protein
VFTDLARKARLLAQRPVLAGWLHRSARFAAAGLVRAEERRQRREAAAHSMENLHPHEDALTDWEKARPVLDEALSEIDEADRDAILLRFFDGRPFAEIGTRLRLTENAARMRVERALDKLNTALAKRGITSSAGALSIALGQQAGAALPAGLATTVSTAALANSVAMSAGWTAGLFAMSKLQMGIVGAVAIAGAAGLVLQAQSGAALRDELASWRTRQDAVAALRVDNRRLAAVVAEIENLRRDDAELKQLAQDAAATQRAIEEQARLGRIRAAQSTTEQNVQAEIERLNREGNRLVEEFKALSVQARNPALTAGQRAAAEADSKTKLSEIQAKQKEVQAFTAAARAANPNLDLGNIGGRYQTSVEGEINYRKSQRAAATEAWSFSSPDPSGAVSLRLPEVNADTALAALEKISGKRVVRDPSLGTPGGKLTVETGPVSPARATQILRAALHEQLKVFVEHGPDGTFVAKPSPPQ